MGMLASFALPGNKNSRRSTSTTKSKASSTTQTLSEWQANVTKRSHEPRSCFLDLPTATRDLVCKLAITLSKRLEDIAASGHLKATNIIPIGRETLDLSAVCCVVNRMLVGLSPYTTPTADDLNEHVSQCITQECCGCRSILAMMDLDGEVIRTFSDDDDGGIIPDSIHAATLSTVIREVEKALAAMDSLLYEGGGMFPPPRTKSSLETMVLQLSERLRMLFSKLKNPRILLRIRRRRGRKRCKPAQQGRPPYSEYTRGISWRSELSVATG